MKPKRPFSVTFLAIGILCFAAILFTRAGSAFYRYNFLASLSPSASPLYLVLTSLFWGLVFLVTAISLWRGSIWVYKTLMGITFVFTAYYWLEQTLIMQNPLKASNWLFLIIMNLIVLAFTAFTLSRPQAKSFFGETNERQPKN